MDEPEKLLSVGEVAALLGLHVQTIYDMARAGTLPSRKYGRVWRFLPDRKSVV